MGNTTSVCLSFPISKKNKEVHKMVDLSTTTIKRLFEKQIKDLTQKIPQEDSFDFQLSGGWIR